MGLTQLRPYFIDGYFNSQFLFPSDLLKSEFPLVGVLYYGLIIVMTDDEKSENVVNLAIIEYFWQTRNFHVDPF